MALTFLKASLLKVLNKFGEGRHATIRKLTLGTQLAVYKDIIPGYRIRPFSEQESQVKISKEVRQQQHFEQALVAGYQAYVRDLIQLSKGRKKSCSEDERSLAGVAISCASSLLLAVPHFNFRGELLTVVVGVLGSHSVDDGFRRCRETLEELFQSDDDGKPSLEAVSLLTKMMKTRNYIIDVSVLDVFLYLRLLSELAFRGSQDKVEKSEHPKEKRLKRRMEKKAFHTKKQKRFAKDQKVVEKEMREADAIVSHEERDRLQSETLKLVFVTYFRILKARPPKLIGAVLEGLAKYAHLINQDFFGDLLEVLRDFIAQERRSRDADDEDNDARDSKMMSADDADPAPHVRQTLLCISTAFSLLQGQSVGPTKSTIRELNIDLSFFVAALYDLLHAVALDPDVEGGSKLPRLQQPESRTRTQKELDNTKKINFRTTMVLLLRGLNSVLLPPQNARSVPPLRLAAFSKQLMTAALHLPEKSSFSTLSLMENVSKIHARKIAALWRTEERKGDGVFDALTGDVEASNPYAATVWEGELLRNHFSPRIRQAALKVSQGSQLV